MTACSDDQEYTYAPLYTDTTSVYIPEQTSSFVFGNADNIDVPVLVQRNTTKGEQTVALQYTFPNTGVKEAPAAVTFKDGQDKATVVYKLVSDSIKGFTNYVLEVKVADGTYNPYKVVSGTFSRNFTVVKEDYQQKQAGQMTDNFWNEASFAAVLEASPSAPYHRIREAWGAGSADIVFTINADNSISFVKTEIATGLKHPSYGAVTATPQAGSKFDPTDNSYHFVFKYTVSAGSFGVYTNVFK